MNSFMYLLERPGKITCLGHGRKFCFSYNYRLQFFREVLLKKLKSDLSWGREKGFEKNRDQGESDTVVELTDYIIFPAAGKCAARY
jgi:hypothetical protein